MFFKNLIKNKKEIALVDDNIKIKYSELYNLVRRITKKIEKNSIILIVVENSSDSVISYLSSINSMNSTTLILDSSFRNEFILNTIIKFKPKYIFLPKKIEFEKYKKITSKFQELNTYDVLFTNFDNSKKNNKNFILLTTSGTTQSSKFVRISKNNLIHNTKKIIEFLRINKKHTTITTMPMGYSYGLSILNTHLYAGGKIVLNKKSILEKNFWINFEKYKISSFGGVPFFYNLLKKINLNTINLNHLIYMTQAGGKLNNQDLEYFGNYCKKYKKFFFVMYGQTEASPRISILKWRNFFDKIGSIGKPFVGSKINIINEKFDASIKRKVGDLEFLGKNCCLGYANNFEDLKLGDTNKGKILTGDIGYKDKNGFYFITGRKKRFIKIFGNRVDLSEIESFMKKQRFKIRCVVKDDRLVIFKKKKYNKNKSILNLVSKFTNINKNYISIHLDNSKSLKEIF